MKDPACTRIMGFSDCVWRELHPLCHPPNASKSAPGFEDPNPGMAASSHLRIAAALERRGLNARWGVDGLE